VAAPPAARRSSSGIAGLVAATLVAKAGLPVIVLQAMRDGVEMRTESSVLQVDVVDDRGERGHTGRQETGG
jgi:hypothetical protein